MKDELPASLIEKQTERAIGADQSRADHDSDCGEHPLSADQSRLRLRGIARPGARLGRGWLHYVSCGRFFRHYALSEGEFVGGFKGRSTDAADDCGAIAADERIV